MQLTAAGLQVRVMVSAVPIPPELPVLIVQPVRGMPAQVTIVITAAVLSSISEIIVNYVNTKKNNSGFGLILYLWTEDR